MILKSNYGPDNQNPMNKTYRLREFNRSGSTNYSFSDSYEELTGRLDGGIRAGWLHGGEIDGWIDDHGWVVCQDFVDGEDRAVSK